MSLPIQNVDNKVESQIIAWARFYLSKGIWTVRVAAGSKSPIDKGWTQIRYNAEHIATAFAGDINIGLLLGEPSNRLADVDLDSRHAVIVGGLILPATGWISGRISKPRSHFFYRAEGAKTVQYNDPVDGERIVELRSTGAQTVVAPSTHPTGEQYRWESDVGALEAAIIDPAELNVTVLRIAATAIVAKHWPKEGGRHEASLVMAGALLEAGVDYDTTLTLIRNAAWAAGDPEYADRARCVESTQAKILAREAVKGWRDAESIFGPVLQQVVKWLGGSSSVVASVDNRPVIEMSADQHLAVDAAVEVLGCAEGVFRRGGLLVHILREGQVPQQIVRPPGAPRISCIELPTLQTSLSRVARFQRVRQLKSGALKKEQAPPAHWLVSAVAARGEWPLVRPLEAFVEFPVIRNDGTLLTSPGYDEGTGLYYEPGPGLCISVPDHPTLDGAVQARDRLLTIIKDFPLVSWAHGATWLSALMTPIAQFSYRGPSPLIAFDGNVRGCGKTLLAHTIGMSLFGRKCSTIPHTTDDEETRKRLLAIAIAGDPIALFDNVNGPLGSPALDMALTSEEVRDRVLGRSEMKSLPLRPLWLATGNNIELAGDTPRRTLFVRLESKDETPESRSGFSNPDLLGFLRQHRSQVLSDALMILRAFFIQGCPHQGLPPWGSFEGWSSVVRQAIVWCGMPDPSETKLTTGGERSKAERLIQGFCEIQRASSPGTYRAMSAGEIIAFVDQYGSQCPFMKDVLTEFVNATGKPSPHKLGKALHEVRTRPVGTLVIDSTERAGQHWWFVRPV